MMAETYLELLKDPAHWMFEGTVILIVDVILAGLCWPVVKRAIVRHDKIKHGHQEDSL